MNTMEALETMEEFVLKRTAHVAVKFTGRLIASSHNDPQKHRPKHEPWVSHRVYMNGNGGWICEISHECHAKGKASRTMPANSERVNCEIAGGEILRCTAVQFRKTIVGVVLFFRRFEQPDAMNGPTGFYIPPPRDMMNRAKMVSGFRNRILGSIEYILRKLEVDEEMFHDLTGEGQDVLPTYADVAKQRRSSMEIAAKVLEDFTDETRARQELVLEAIQQGKPPQEIIAKLYRKNRDEGSGREGREESSGHGSKGNESLYTVKDNGKIYHDSMHVEWDWNSHEDAGDNRRDRVVYHDDQLIEWDWESIFEG